MVVVRCRHSSNARRACMRDVNKVSFNNSSRGRPLKLSTKALCIGFSAQPRMALLVSSVRLALTIVLGPPRGPIRRSSSRVTRRLKSEVLATAAKHARVRRRRSPGCKSAGQRPVDRKRGQVTSVRYVASGRGVAPVFPGPFATVTLACSSR